MTDEQLTRMAQRVLGLLASREGDAYYFDATWVAEGNEVDAAAVAILREEMGKHDTVTAAELPDLFSDDPTQTIVIDT